MGEISHDFSQLLTGIILRQGVSKVVQMGYLPLKGAWGHTPQSAPGSIIRHFRTSSLKPIAGV